MPAGRPEDDYSTQVEMGWEYLTKFEGLKEVIPTVAGYAQYCRTSGFPVSRDTIYRRSEFSDIIDQIHEIQEHKLIAGGLSGDYHPRFAQFLLAAKHNYVETKGVSGKDGGPIALIDMSSDDGTES